MSSHLKGMAQALKKKAGVANNFTPALNNITGDYSMKKPREVRLNVVPSPKKKEYKIPKTPSNGVGVGY